MNWKKKLYNISKIIYLIIGFSIIVISCKDDNKANETSRVQALPYFNEATFTPYWLTPGSQEEKKFHIIPDFTLVNQLGDTITNETFDNKIYVTDFFFTTCPGICPKMTDNMYKLQKEFRDDSSILLLSHSVTPEYDSVPVLQKYAKEKEIIDNKWHLVTGDRKQIYDLGRNHYFVEEDLGKEKDKDDFLHTENFLLIDRNKHIRGIYNGLNSASINQLIVDINTLKLENSF